ncbi:Laccase-4 [Dactylella cylindrospora]|nr:Laccase-4 [Dactylella cylindrospora]
MVFAQKYTLTRRHDGELVSERNTAREGGRSIEMQRKRKALVRSILLLLVAGILTISVGVLLTGLDHSYSLHRFRLFSGFRPSYQGVPESGSDSSSNITLSNNPRSFMRDPSEYILSPPPWSRIRVRPKVKEYEWNITDVFANPDGVFRPMILINGQFPGPLIECNEHDVVRVKIYNRATNATSFHWHGLFHNGSNWMDGTAGVTQCPIPPGESFTYEFNTTGQYGTYWYHSHFSTQYTDGLFGPLVVHSPSEPGTDKYKTDQVVMLHDHYHDLSRNKLYEYLAPDNENAEPIPDGALINGRNVIETKYGCNATGAELAEIRLQPGQSHRLRFINVGAFAEFEVSMDQHTMDIIEADGTPLVPSSYHRLNINVAQRYSAVVHANSTNATEFWLRARMINHCFSDPEDVIEPEVRAVVRYATAKKSKTDSKPTRSTVHARPLPTTEPWDGEISLVCKDVDGKLDPAVPVPAPEPDMLVYLRSNFEIGNYSLSRGFFNASSWKTDLRNPRLNQVLSVGVGNDATLGPEGVMNNIFEAEKGMVLKVDGIKVVDLLIDNYDDG